MRLIATSALAFLLAACSTDNGGAEHGPSFDDGGADGASDARPQGEAGADASSDARPEAGTDSGACTAEIAVVGGSASIAFASVLGAGGAWTGGTLAGSAASTPAVALLVNDFIAVFHASDDSLRSTGFASSWSPLTAVAAFGVRDAPALAAVGSTMHLAYQRKTSDAGADDYKYFHGQYTTTWDGANDPVGGAGPSQSYGALAPTAANIGGKFVLANVGGNAHVYAQTLDTTWQPAMSVTGSPDAGAGPAIQDFRPPIVALEGSNDAMIVFVGTDYKLRSVTHSAGGWSTPLLVDANAFLAGAPPFYPPTLVGTPGGHAALAWRGTDGKPYFSLFSGASWSPPAPFLTPNPAIDSYPALAKGVCGADAVGAYVESGGALKLVRLTGAAWSAPVAVPGAGGLTSVAVATRP